MGFHIFWKLEAHIGSVLEGIDCNNYCNYYHQSSLCRA